MMTSTQRVLAACQFRKPDRLPRFDSFWSFPEAWRRRLGDPDELTDIAIWCPDETTFPTRVRHLRKEGDFSYDVENWGRTVRSSPDAYFVETLEAPLGPGVDIDAVEFDSPYLDGRYLAGCADEETLQRRLARAKERHCVFGKTGGPYLRSTFVRGETEFLMDIAGDPGLARAIADKVGDHLTAVGCEEIRRWALQETGIWIYDDMAYNHGPMFSPDQFERILLPAYRRMIRAYRDAGARYVFLHSDGDIRPILDMLVDAGIDGLNPLERRANMKMEVLRGHYPRLVLTGGMCNTRTLVSGTAEEIEAQARLIIDLGRDGGVVIGTHSISPEVPLDKFEVYHRACLTYGDFSTGASPAS